MPSSAQRLDDDMRVVFDTSSFHYNTFPKLKNSTLIKRTKAGSVIPMYGPVFLEEIINTFGVEGKRHLLINDWIPFILATVHRFVDERDAILHRELIQGHGKKTNIYMPRKAHENVARVLNNVPIIGTWQYWEKSKRDREIARKTQANNFDLFRKTRAKTNEWRRASRSNISPLPLLFSLYVNEELAKSGRVLLSYYLKSAKAKYPEAILDRWAKSPHDYPYSSTFVSNMLYHAFYTVKPNDRLDPNADADSHIMLNLLRGDILVSDETGFLNTAFNDIWRPKGKILLTVDEFVNVIS